MGYNTEFKGNLKFNEHVKISDLAKLNGILGEDVRDHPEWDVPKDSGLYYIDLELNDDITGIRWDGSEKTYGMQYAIELVIRLMRFSNPDFGLNGQLIAQGEEIDDRWVITVKDDKVTRTEIAMRGKKIKCPHCEEHFYLEDEE